MRKTKKVLLSCFLALLMAFVMVPYVASAEETTGTTYEVTDEASLLQALYDASDGDTINIGSDEVYASITIDNPINIKKDLTINFVSGQIDYYPVAEFPGDVIILAEAVVTISDCDVTITGNGGFMTAYNEVYAFKLQDVNANASLTIDSPQFIDDGFLIVDDSSNDFTTTLTIENGSYSIPTERTTAFTFSDGTEVVETGSLVVYGGSFQEDITAYLGENTTVIDNGEGYQTRYEVRSTIMSPEFASMLTDGKLVVSSVVPEAEDMDGYAYVMGQLCSYETPEVEYYPQYISDGVWDIGAWDSETGDLLEMHRVEVVFEADIDEEALAIAQDIADNIPYKEFVNEWEDEFGEIHTETWRMSPFRITDMEVVNMWANGYDINDPVKHRHTANYSGELKEYLGNANVDFRVTMIGAGADSDLYLEANGDAVVLVNGVMYAAAPYSVSGVVEHIIYVPDGTDTDKDALIAAAQKRINEYLGSDTKVVVSYGGAFNTLSDEWYDDQEIYRQDMLDGLGLDVTPEHYFIATAGDMQYKFLIVPDSSKMITPTYKTVDATSNVTITSDAAGIPLDASMRANQLTSGDTYDEIIKTLGVDENVTFDLSIYSCSKLEYISSLTDSMFQVSIPIPDNLKDKKLVAYYVDEEGEVIRYPAEPIDDCAVFETNHFSIYTIAEGEAAEEGLTVLDDGSIVYYEEGELVKAQWKKVDEEWYYFGEDGVALVGWQQIGGTWYYFYEDATMAAGEWIDGCYLDNSGAWSQPGWKKTGNKWWYCNADGSYPVSQWMQNGNKWYYFDSEGWMTTGWQLVGGKWYYMDSNGQMTTGWQLVGGKWYYMKNTGEMATGWQLVGGTWYYMDSNGQMTTGWQLVGGKWYYMKNTGEMATGWQLVSGKWYYMNKDGVMLSNTTVDGYKLDKNGVWVQ